MSASPMQHSQRQSRSCLQPQPLELGRPPDFARDLAGDEVDEIELRVEAREYLGTVLRAGHGGAKDPGRARRLSRYK